MSLPDALKALTYAKKEYDKYVTRQDPLLLRDTSEKAWLAVVLATDVLLIKHGFKKPESYRERRSMLRELIAKVPKIGELGIIDRLGARGYYLHILDFHEGALDPEDLKEELKKTEEYLKIIETLLL